MSCIKRIIVLVLIAVLCAPFVSGCQNHNQLEQSVWSAPNTLKVMQQKYDYSKGPAKIDILMGKGETEGGQIIVTPKNNVKSFNMKSFDLVSENGDVIPASQIEIFMQCYINVQIKTFGNNNLDYPTGYTPDMLLPIDKAVEYKENTIKAGNNQGFTIDVKTTSDTQAGKYSGKIMLYLDKKEIEIPVNVEVADIDLTKSYGKTSVMLYQYILQSGEMNNSSDTYKAYYDKMLNEYKTCLMYVPNSYDIDQFLDSLLSYWDNPSFTSYCIPNSGKNLFYKQLYKDYVKLLAKASTPDRLLLEKAYLYPIMVDEPSTNEQTIKLESLMQSVMDVKEEVIQELVTEGFYDNYGGANGQFAKALEESLNISIVITTEKIEQFGDTINTYCPPIQYYSTQKERRVYDEHEKLNKTEKWYYTCMLPQYPYPSHHIDDYLIGSRIMRWMQKAYNIEGYLYWNAAMFEKVTNDYGHIITDPYTDPVRFSEDLATVYNGDGYLTYPGYKYDMNTFLPSIRLYSLRDGQEDYNLIQSFQNILNELSIYYGTEKFDVNEIIQGFYNQLFTTTIYESNDALFNEIKTKLFNYVIAAKSESKLIVNSVLESDGIYRIEIYAAEGYSVELNGRMLSGQKSGQGEKYIVRIDGTNGSKLNITASKDSKTTSLKALRLSAAEGINAEELTANMTVSEDSKVIRNGSETIVDIMSSGEGAIEQAVFVPYFQVGAKSFNTNMHNIKNLNFTIKNESNYELTIKVLAMTDGRSRQIDVLLIKSGETIDVTLNNIYKSISDTATSFDGIRFTFSNTDAKYQKFPVRQVVLSNMTYTHK